MRPFLEEFSVPLKEVKRTWLRRSVIILFAFTIVPAIALIAAFGEFIEAIEWSYKNLSDCWKTPPKEQE